MQRNNGDITPSTSSNNHDGAVLMTAEHKRVLRENRDALIENLVLDEFLISRLENKSVFSSADARRLREIENDDERVQRFLTLLNRRPDNAFKEFVLALRDLDQRHIAHTLDPNREVTSTPTSHGLGSPSTPRRSTHASSNATPGGSSDAAGGSGARQGGGLPRSNLAGGQSPPDDSPQEDQSTPKRRIPHTVRVRAEVDSAQEYSDDEDTEFADLTPDKNRARAQYKDKNRALKKALEREILETSLVELRNLKEIVKCGISPQHITQRQAVLNTLKGLQEMKREVLGAYDGSVVYVVYCPTVAALEDLKNNLSRIQQLMVKDFISDKLKQRYRVVSVRLSVSLLQGDYDLCLQELVMDKENIPCKHRHPSTGSSNGTKLQQTPTRQFPSFMTSHGRHQPISRRGTMTPVRLFDISPDGNSSSGVSSGFSSVEMEHSDTSFSSLDDDPLTYHQLRPVHMSTA